MPYIDSDYYLSTYKGKYPNDEKELDKLILRASEAIDRLTRYNITESLLNVPIIKDRVQLATAKIVEYYIINGGYEVIKSDSFNQVSIGSFSYMEAQNFNDPSSNDRKEYPNEVEDILSSVGLMYSGIEVKQ